MSITTSKIQAQTDTWLINYWLASNNKLNILNETEKKEKNSFTSFNFVKNLHYIIGITQSLKQVKLALIVIPLSQKIFMTFDSLKRLYENCQLKILKASISRLEKTNWNFEETEIKWMYENSRFSAYLQLYNSIQTKHLRFIWQLLHVI